MRHLRSGRLLLVCLLASAIFSTAQSEPNAPKYFFVLLKRPSNAPQLSKEAGDTPRRTHGKHPQIAF
jgi:hypothetical protein